MFKVIITNARLVSDPRFFGTTGKEMTSVRVATNQSQYKGGEYIDVAFFYELVIPPARNGVHRSLATAKKGDIISAIGTLEIDPDTNTVPTYNDKPQVKVKIASVMDIEIIKKSSSQPSQSMSNKRGDIHIMDDDFDLNAAIDQAFPSF